jgi:hypothetical protein
MGVTRFECRGHIVDRLPFSPAAATSLVCQLSLVCEVRCLTQVKHLWGAPDETACPPTQCGEVVLEIVGLAAVSPPSQTADGIGKKCPTRTFLTAQIAHIAFDY